MAIQIITGFNSNSREALDKRSGPYETVALALAALSTISRYVGLKVEIVTGAVLDPAGNFIGGTREEYVFTGGIDDIHFVPSQSGGSSPWVSGSGANSAKINNPSLFADGDNSIVAGNAESTFLLKALSNGSFIFSHASTKDVEIHGIDSAIIGGRDSIITSTGDGNIIIGSTSASIINDGYANGIYNSNNSTINSRRAAIIGGNGNTIDAATIVDAAIAIIASYGVNITTSFPIVVLGLNDDGGPPSHSYGRGGVYVDGLNIRNLPSGTSVSNLGIDADGYICTGTKEANINNHSVSTTTNLGNTLSRSELDTLIPSPIQGELYGVQDNNNHSFLVIYDGTDFWYERFTKAN